MKCEHARSSLYLDCSACALVVLIPIATAAKKYIEGKSGKESCDAYQELKDAVKQWDDSTTENGR